MLISDCSAAPGPAREAETASGMADQEQPQPAVYRLTEVAQHNTSRGENKSIWTVIHDKVYDITQFLDEVICCAIVLWCYSL